MFDNMKFWKRKDDWQSTNTGLPVTEPHPMDERINQAMNQTDPALVGAQQYHPTFDTNSMSDMLRSANSGQLPVQNISEQKNETTSSIDKRDVELILAKLETIKVSLDNLSHRVEKLEHKDQKNLW